MLQEKNWVNLAFIDLKIKYKYSSFGPFWITITNLITVLVLGFVYSTIFKSEFNEFFLNLGIGFIVWNYFSSLACTSVSLLLENRNIILNYKLSIDFFIKKYLLLQLLIFFHNIPIFFGFILVFNINFNLFDFIYLIFSLALINILALNFIKVFAMLAIRFRDIPIIFQNLFSISFFATPIIWTENMLLDTKFEFLLIYNPFYHLIEIIRDPIKSNQINFINILVVLSLIIAMFIFSKFIFNKYKYVYKTWY